MFAVALLGRRGGFGCRSCCRSSGRFDEDGASGSGDEADAVGGDVVDGIGGDI
jgi:hypothetical protein